MTIQEKIKDSTYLSVKTQTRDLIVDIFWDKSFNKEIAQDLWHSIRNEFNSGVNRHAASNFWPSWFEAIIFVTITSTTLKGIPLE